MNLVENLFENTKNLEKNLVLGQKEIISYKEAYKKIEEVSRLARSFGCKKGDNVVLLSNNSVFWITAYFGIIKAGCVSIPINTRLSDEHTREIFDVTRAKVAFVGNNMKKKFERLNIEAERIVFENEMEKELAEIPPDFDDAKPDINEKEDVAAIFFTSGSEGKQKGVMITHNNITANTGSILGYLDIKQHDVMETVLPFYYCYGTSLLHTHVKVGASLVLNNKFLFPGTVAQDIKKYNCTGFAGVPSTFQILLRVAKLAEQELPSLRYITQAGGRLSNNFIKEMISAVPKAKFIVMYGQTEATARLSYLPPELIDKKLGSIGKSIPGVTLEVLNNAGNPVKPDETGEIVASGANIMKGYFNDPDGTNAVIKNGKLYTRDMAIVDEEGFIYIVSREKQMIKTGGNRVSPKEIEDVITEIPEVINAAMIGVEDDILGEAIKAFIVVEDRDKNLINEKYIKDYCKKRLESFKVPKYVKFIKTMPMNSYGKVLVEELKKL